MNWKEERDQVVQRARRVVVKVGSAVLAGAGVLDRAVVESLAKAIAGLHARGVDVVLVSSGAVAAGRGVIRSNAREGELRGLPDKQAAAAIGQSRLMHAYDQAFGGLSIITAQILLTKDDFRSRQRFLNACHTFDTLLSWRVVPIVNENDSVAVQELVFGDNDSLAALVLNLVEADLLVNLTSAAGVFAGNPDTTPGAVCLDRIENIAALDVDALCGGKTSVGTGGMRSKLLAARRAAQLGAPTLILSGKDPANLTRFFAGEELGTWVVPESKKISRRKFRLAYNSEPVGAIRVDAGAAKALTEKGKSLLAAGITAVEGSFGRGALARILGPDGRRLGVGLCNYRAEDLKKICGKRTSDIEAALGPGFYPEVVHRDNMLLDAVV